MYSGNTYLVVFITLIIVTYSRFLDYKIALRAVLLRVIILGVAVRPRAKLVSSKL